MKHSFSISIFTFFSFCLSTTLCNDTQVMRAQFHKKRIERINREEKLQQLKIEHQRNNNKKKGNSDMKKLVATTFAGMAITAGLNAAQLNQQQIFALVMLQQLKLQQPVVNQVDLALQKLLKKEVYDQQSNLPHSVQKFNKLTNTKKPTKNKYSHLHQPKSNGRRRG